MKYALIALAMLSLSGCIYQEMSVEDRAEAVSYCSEVDGTIDIVRVGKYNNGPMVAMRCIHKTGTITTFDPAFQERRRNAIAYCVRMDMDAVEVGRDISCENKPENTRPNFGKTDWVKTDKKTEEKLTYEY